MRYLVLLIDQLEEKNNGLRPIGVMDGELPPIGADYQIPGEYKSINCKVNGIRFSVKAKDETRRELSNLEEATDYSAIVYLRQRHFFQDWIVDKLMGRPNPKHWKQ